MVKKVSRNFNFHWTYPVLPTTLGNITDSSPQLFWHQGPRQFFHGPGVAGRMVSGWFKCIMFIMLLLVWQKFQTVMQVMGSGCKYRWNFAHSPTVYLRLCGLVPNRSWTGTRLWPWSWGPWCKVSYSLPYSIKLF